MKQPHTPGPPRVPTSPPPSACPEPGGCPPYEPKTKRTQRTKPNPLPSPSNQVRPPTLPRGWGLLNRPSRRALGPEDARLQLLHRVQVLRRDGPTARHPDATFAEKPLKAPWKRSEPQNRIGGNGETGGSLVHVIGNAKVKKIWKESISLILKIDER